MADDRGVSNERIALAWQRSALSLAAGSAAICTLTFERLGVAALLSMAVTLALTGWVLLESRLRYQHDAGPA